MVDLRALRYFVAAYEEGSVTAAARRCAISQPAITNALQALEADLQVQLFVRTRRGLERTRDAEILHARAVRLISDATAIEREFRTRAPRTVALHVQPDVSLRRAAPILRAVYDAWPDLVLRLVASPAQADLVVGTEACFEVGRAFLPLWTEPYVVLAPAGDPIRFKSPVRPADLEGRPLIERTECRLHSQLEAYLASAGIKPDIRATTADEDAVVALVALGVGMAIAPASHAQGVEGVVACALSPEVSAERTVGIGWRQEGDHGELAQAVAVALTRASMASPPVRG